jgi:C4-dicarboxylate-specific signal transduction histidine kinase
MNDLGNILIVDDNPNNLQVLMSLLVNEGYKVRPALSGEIALRAVEASLPELILLDVRMPGGLSGYDTCKQLQANELTRDIPIIFISAMDGTEDKLDGFRAGAVDYVAKPFQTEEVLARVKTHVHLYRIQQHLESLVEARTRELNALNTELEDRVLDRTAELTRTMDKLTRTQTELIQSAKLASLGFMVAGVAHELNTPVGNALMATSTLTDLQRVFEASLEKGITRSALNAYLDSVRELTALAERNLQRTVKLINNFKQVAVDQTSEQRRSFNLDELVRATILNLHQLHTKSYCNLTCDIPEGIHFHSFPGAIEQILANFIHNAYKHAFLGRDFGNMHLQAKLIGENSVRITFSDDGVGIAEEHISKIFDPFFTTKLGQGGSGLGLSIVQNIVTGVLGGHIEVHSTIGVGTEFVLELPLS